LLVLVLLLYQDLLYFMELNLLLILRTLTRITCDGIFYYRWLHILWFCGHYNHWHYYRNFTGKVKYHVQYVSICWTYIIVFGSSCSVRIYDNTNIEKNTPKFKIVYWLKAPKNQLITYWEHYIIYWSIREDVWNCLYTQHSEEFVIVLASDLKDANQQLKKNSKLLDKLTTPNNKISVYELTANTAEVCW
jgi:hypothetical protein